MTSIDSGRTHWVDWVLAAAPLASAVLAFAGYFYLLLWPLSSLLPLELHDHETTYQHPSPWHLPADHHPSYHLICSNFGILIFWSDTHQLP